MSFLQALHIALKTSLPRFIQVSAAGRRKDPRKGVESMAINILPKKQAKPAACKKTKAKKVTKLPPK